MRRLATVGLVVALLAVAVPLHVRIGWSRMGPEAAGQVHRPAGAAESLVDQ